MWPGGFFPPPLSFPGNLDLLEVCPVGRMLAGDRWTPRPVLWALLNTSLKLFYPLSINWTVSLMASRALPACFLERLIPQAELSSQSPDWVPFGLEPPSLSLASHNTVTVLVLLLARARMCWGGPPHRPFA